MSGCRYCAANRNSSHLRDPTGGREQSESVEWVSSGCVVRVSSGVSGGVVIALHHGGFCLGVVGSWASGVIRVSGSSVHGIICGGGMVRVMVKG